MWQRLNFLGRRTVTAVIAVIAVIANGHLSFARGVWKLARLRLAAVGEVTHQVPGRKPRADTRAAAGALLVARRRVMRSIRKTDTSPEMAVCRSSTDSDLDIAFMGR